MITMMPDQRAPLTGVSGNQPADETSADYTLPVGHGHVGYRPTQTRHPSQVEVGEVSKHKVGPAAKGYSSPPPPPPPTTTVAVAMDTAEFRARDTEEISFSLSKSKFGVLKQSLDALSMAGLSELAGEALNVLIESGVGGLMQPVDLPTSQQNTALAGNGMALAAASPRLINNSASGGGPVAMGTRHGGQERTVVFGVRAPPGEDWPPSVRSDGLTTTPSSPGSSPGSFSPGLRAEEDAAAVEGKFKPEIGESSRDMMSQSRTPGWGVGAADPDSAPNNDSNERSLSPRKCPDMTSPVMTSLSFTDGVAATFADDRNLISLIRGGPTQNSEENREEKAYPEPQGIITVQPDLIPMSPRQEVGKYIRIGQKRPYFSQDSMTDSGGPDAKVVRTAAGTEKEGEVPEGEEGEGEGEKQLSSLPGVLEQQVSGSAGTELSAILSWIRSVRRDESGEAPPGEEGRESVYQQHVKPDDEFTLAIGGAARLSAPDHQQHVQMAPAFWSGGLGSPPPGDTYRSMTSVTSQERSPSESYQSSPIPPIDSQQATMGRSYFNVFSDDTTPGTPASAATAATSAAIVHAPQLYNSPSSGPQGFTASPSPVSMTPSPPHPSHQRRDVISPTTGLRSPGSCSDFTAVSAATSPESRTPPSPRQRNPSGEGEGVWADLPLEERPPPHQLPPCKVCGVQATGFHYGVNTCEACKGFFRRSIVRKQEYVCANNSIKCAVRPGKRNTCASCRYKKCLEAGMSLDGIKIGRYTYAKRTKDILELRQLTTDVSTSPSDGSKMTRDSEIQQYIEEIVACHESRYPECLQTLSLVQKVQEQIKDQGGGIQEAHIALDEFLKVFCSTGVQLDDRLQILNQWVLSLEEGLRLVVSFAKDIPGFKDLHLVDQMALIKHSICEVWVVSRHKAFHKDYNYFTSCSGFTFNVVKALGEQLGTEVLSVARQLQQLDLNIHETIILKAFCVFFTDRCELQEPGKVEAIQDRLLEAFLHLLHQNHRNDKTLFAKVIAALTNLRDVTEYYHGYAQRLMVAGALSLPPLFLEVVTLKKT